MKELQYYYGEPGKEIRGPLEIKTLQAAAEAGELSADVILSEDGSEPWIPLDEVVLRGRNASRTAKATPFHPSQIPPTAPPKLLTSKANS